MAISRPLAALRLAPRPLASTSLPRPVSRANTSSTPPRMLRMDRPPLPRMPLMDSPLLLRMPLMGSRPLLRMPLMGNHHRKVPRTDNNLLLANTAPSLHTANHRPDTASRRRPRAIR